MPKTVYPQFCALARAAEIVGERWTLLIVRELLLGPKRFSDLADRLSGVSSAVLSERLRSLEESGLVGRRWLEPPAASTVYELTPDGEALRPAVFELIRWGGRFLLPQRPGERVEPDWMRLALAAYVPQGPTPARSFNIRIRDGGAEAVIHVGGGPDGTAIEAGAGPADLDLTADFPTALGLVLGFIDPSDALSRGVIRAEGDLTAVAELPLLFEGDGQKAR